MSGVLPQVGLFFEGRKLVLELPKRLQALDGDVLKRRLRNVAKEVDASSEVRVSQRSEPVRPSLLRSLIGRASDEGL
jgi:hypothetical protein